MTLKRKRTSSLSLPEDLQLEILSFLPNFIDRYEISKINSEWYQLGQKPIYWKECVLAPGELYHSHLILNKKKWGWIPHFCQLAQFCTKILIEPDVFYQQLLCLLMPCLHVFLPYIQEIKFLYYYNICPMDKYMTNNTNFLYFTALKCLKIECQTLDPFGSFYFDTFRLPESCTTLHLIKIGLLDDARDIRKFAAIHHLLLDNCHVDTDDGSPPTSVKLYVKELQWESLTFINMDCYDYVEIIGKQPSGINDTLFNFFRKVIPLCLNLKSITFINCQIDQNTKYLQACFPHGKIHIINGSSSMSLQTFESVGAGV